MSHVKHRQLPFIHFFALTLLWMCSAAPKKAKIVQLTDQNYQSYVVGNRQVLINFYSNQCESCKQFEYEYQKLYWSLKEVVDHELPKTFSIRLARMNVDQNPQTIKKLRVNEIPSLFYFHLSVPFEFVMKEVMEENTVARITEWIYQSYQDRIIPIQHQSQLMNLHRPFVYYQGSNQEHIEVINMACFQLENLKVYWKKNEFEESMGAYLRKTQQIHEYDDRFDLSVIRPWLLWMDQSAIIHLNHHQKIEKVLHHRQKGALLIILANEEDQNNNKTLDIILEICEEMKFEIQCGKVTKNDDMFHGSHDYFKVEDNNVSIIGYVTQRMKVGYIYEKQAFDKVTEQNLRQFIEYARGQMLERVVDYNIPEQIKLKHVQLWDKNRLEHMISTHKYVLVKFYHPHDQRSKEVSIHFDQFASDIEKHTHNQLIVGAVDCIQEMETCTAQAIKNYPTMKIYVKGHGLEYIPPQQHAVYPQMAGFIGHVISASTIKIGSLSDIRKNPAIVFYGQKITQQMEVFPKIYDKYPCYFMSSKDQGDRMQYHVDEQIQVYKGEFKINIMKNWVDSQKKPYLVNLITSEKVGKAMKEKQDILFWIDGLENMEFVQQQKLYTRITKQLQKKFDFLGGIIDHDISSIDHFLEWIGIDKSFIRQNKLVYFANKDQLKYVFPESLAHVTPQKVQKFIEDIKNNKIQGFKRFKVLKGVVLPDEDL